MKRENSQQNILFLFNTGDVIGGGEISFFDLLKNLDQTSFKPFVVCPRKGNLVDKLKKSGFKVKLIEMPSFRSLNLFKIIKSVVGLARWLRKNKIRLVHANGSRCALYAVLSKKFFNFSLLWHVRVMARDPWLDPFLAQSVNTIIANSESVKKRFSGIESAQNKVRVIYNGFDFNSFTASSVTKDLRKELSLPKSIPVIGMIGRIDSYKDHKTLLEAARVILDRSPTVRFLLAGSGEKESFIKEYAQQLKVEHAIHFLGDRDDVVNIYAALDIFVLSTLSEGFGRVLVEALAMKKPVVATKVGGVTEIIQDNFSGLLVRKGSAKQLAQAVEKLINNPTLSKKLAIWGNKEVKKKFPIQAHVAQVEELYKEQLGIGKERKIRIGIDWREFEQGKSTGIARYLEGVTQHLFQLNHKWDVKLFGNQKTTWKSFVPNRAKHRITEQFTPWWDQVTLPKNIRKEKCRLFLSPYFKAPLFSSSPVVLIVNDLIPIKNIYFRKLLQKNIKKAAAIITISDVVRKELIALDPKVTSKTETIPLGVSSHFSPGASNKTLLRNKLRIRGRYLLYVGNANPHKNLRTLIKSLNDIAHFELVLCGVDRKKNSDLKELVSKNGLKERVHFLSKVSDEQLLSLYRGAEIFIFPSLSEGFGLPPLEAMACGVPVIASRIPTTKEVLGDSALFVNAKKSKEISNAVNLVYKDNSLKKELIEKGKKRAALFSEKKMASAFEACLESIYAKYENSMDIR